MSRSRVRVSSRRSLSRWCRPMDGSSKTYITPVSPEPICEASRMRWASPPDKVPDWRESDRYSSPTLFKKFSRSTISFKILWAISRFCGLSFSSAPANHPSACLIDMAETSMMSSPAILIASASGFRRLPPQCSQTAADWYWANSSRVACESVSIKRRSRLLTTPSNGLWVTKRE